MEKEVDDVVTPIIGFHPQFALSIAISRDGRILLAKGYGYASRGPGDLPYSPPVTDFPTVRQSPPRAKKAADAETIYEIGSITKQFTAASILLLQQEGKVSINDSVSTYFPTFVKGSSIKLSNLLDHTSGIRDYTDKEFFRASGLGMDSYRNIDAVLKHLALMRPEFPPGSRFEYSNSNYLILGKIIEMVSHQKLGDFFRQRFFAPLKMTRTAYGTPRLGANDVATGYTYQGGEIRIAPTWDLFWADGAGGLTSTATDLIKWDDALDGGTVIRGPLQGAMMAARPETGAADYALGLVSQRLLGHRYVWHNGGIGGFQSMNATFPDDRLNIVILTNNDYLQPDRLAREIFTFIVLSLDKDRRSQASGESGQHLHTASARS